MAKFSVKPDSVQQGTIEFLLDKHEDFRSIRCQKGEHRQDGKLLSKSQKCTHFGMVIIDVPNLVATFKNVNQENGCREEQ